MTLQVTDKDENNVAEVPVEFNRVGFWDGVRLSSGIALGVLAYGIVFGALAGQAGLSPLEVALMSGLVFAGASQFAALGSWAAAGALPILPIILTTLIVNLRHILMSASLHQWYKHVPTVPRYLTIFFLNDESYALTVAQFQKGKRNAAFLLGSGGLLFVAWMSATVGGRLLGNLISDPAKWGLDFAFTAVFLALLVGMWRGKGSLLPWLVAAVVAGITAWLVPDGKWYILAGGIAGSIAGVLQNGD
jgi:4-azaleucine resistance transporter AzlC